MLRNRGQVDVPFRWSFAPAHALRTRRPGDQVRWVGVAEASVRAVEQLLFIPAYPFWSLTLIILDFLVISGLVVFGKRSVA